MSTKMTYEDSNQCKLPPFKDLMQKANDQGIQALQPLAQQDYPSAISKYPSGALLTPELPRLSPFTKRRYINGSASPSFLQSPTVPNMPVRNSAAKYETSSSPYNIHVAHYHRQSGGGFFQFSGSSPQGRAQSLSFCESNIDHHNPFRRAADDQPPSSSKFILPSPTVSMSRRESLTDSFEGFISTANSTAIYGKSFCIEGGDFNGFPTTPMTEISETSTVVDQHCAIHHRRNVASAGAVDGYMDEQMRSGNGPSYSKTGNGPGHGQVRYLQNERQHRHHQNQHQQNRPPPPPQQLPHRYYSAGSGTTRNNGDTAMTKLERRRKAHLDSEKRRRGNIKNGMDELMGLIPGCSAASSELAQQDGKANSKAIILRKAKDYIIQLMKKIEEVERERDRIENEYRVVEAEKEHFKMENERLLAVQQCSGHHDFRCTL